MFCLEDLKQYGHKPLSALPLIIFTGRIQGKIKLLSDFADSGSIRFIIHGGLLIAISITMAIMMFRKYYIIQNKANDPI